MKRLLQLSEADTNGISAHSSGKLNIDLTEITGSCCCSLCNQRFLLCPSPKLCQIKSKHSMSTKMSIAKACFRNQQEHLHAPQTACTGVSLLSIRDLIRGILWRLKVVYGQRVLSGTRTLKSKVETSPHSSHKSIKECLKRWHSALKKFLTKQWAYRWKCQFGLMMPKTQSISLYHRRSNPSNQLKTLLNGLQTKND